ncbi:hypothetical protein SLA2020_132900 [Shorea laevis]
MQNSQPHAALLVSPGMGHFIPALELGKRMATHHGFHVTVFIVAEDHASTSLLKSPNNYPENLDVVLLPPVDISAIVGPDASLTVKMIFIMRQSLPLLRSEILAMKIRPTMLIVDIFGTEAFTIADEFEMLRYVFITSNAWLLALSVYSSAAAEEVTEEHVKKHKPLKIPGCKSIIRFEDTLDALQDPNDPLLQGFIALGGVISKADGILVNTWEDLETSTIQSFRDTKLLGQIVEAVYPIGPLVRWVGQGGSDHPVMNWLDKQPAKSVIYVSFGSGGTLSAKQMIELAWGLELSRQRFIWVVRPPSDHDASGSYFTIRQGIDVDSDYLPDGFLNRTRDVGFVVPMWAPQVDILSHPSVGGFLSHCGWNSTLESIMNGVPMVAWPLYAEQKMNAALLAEEIEVAIRPKQSPAGDGVVGRKEVEKMVRKIMVEEEGRAMRKRAVELKYSGEKALSKGACSYNSLSQVAKECLQCLMAKSGGA